jgi:hypothetical protein
MPLYNFSGAMVLFIHIPKAGGTTIEFALSNYCMGLLDRNFKGEFFPCSPQHFHAMIIDKVLDLSAISLQFTIVRSPLDRLKSEYFWQRRFFGLNQEFNDWAIESLSRLNLNRFIFDNHLRPMTEFVTPSVKWFRIEDGLDQVYSFLVDLFGELNFKKPVRHMMNSGERPKTDISEETLSLIKTIYGKDIEMFGY